MEVPDGLDDLHLEFLLIEALCAEAERLSGVSEETRDSVFTDRDRVVTGMHEWCGVVFWRGARSHTRRSGRQGAAARRPGRRR
ncbi:hypothetical protein SAMN05444920_115244 [Nonomuraea solani]|uniref:Uncharacterized protein n=1 Tax=Nonomuraea solani TaxID=1144553 RepID=A0A1H6ETK3_9ACTN|nr:hypothetical protein SAMN05444920_115244 [Nonomuraea solani]